ncbi:hypothetical protein CROQUDRAFT_663935 [Cronartium quercuum f. sp. fusiforme G11]|uniref:Uncharacterized protein n=1 Tax=Cronartium quercuum f. sp. fusiforme G11 TaxID=708437 RepID=A0A9P6T792_9BASI|nr:hypothetical protein CROQUDRAFT_663935 [Cronartium quercuum f. sp. fusiforme G11]
MSPFTNQPTSATLVHFTSQLNVIHSTDWFSLTRSPATAHKLSFTLLACHFISICQKKVS